MQVNSKCVFTVQSRHTATVAPSAGQLFGPTSEFPSFNISFESLEIIVICCLLEFEFILGMLNYKTLLVAFSFFEKGFYRISFTLPRQAGGGLEQSTRRGGSVRLIFFDCAPFS